MPPIRILFVCLGNICRSPAAEGILQHQIELQGRSHEFQIDSAGIGNWHQGQLPDPRMREHGQRRGYQFLHRARQLTRADYDRFDLIIGMDEENLKDIERRSPHAEGKKKIRNMALYLQHHPHDHTIPDPYYGSGPDFEKVLDLLEDACSGLLESFQNKK